MASDRHSPQDEPDIAPTLKMRRVFPMPLAATPPADPPPAEHQVSATDEAGEAPPLPAEADDPSPLLIAADEASALPPQDDTPFALPDEEDPAWQADDAPLTDAAAPIVAIPTPDASAPVEPVWEAPAALFPAAPVAVADASTAMELQVADSADPALAVVLPPSDAAQHEDWPLYEPVNYPAPPPAEPVTPVSPPRWMIAEESAQAGDGTHEEPPPSAAGGFVASMPALPAPLPPFIDEGSQPPIDPAPAFAVQAASPLDDEEDTPVKQYEYCRLVLDSGQYSQTQGRYPYFVRVTLDYYGAQSAPSYKFNQDTDKMDGPDKTWGRMLGLLGAAGWEMLNITIGKAKDLSILEAMAYFKRPVEVDREIDQPAISL